jgi:hypothetical protein
MGVTLTTHDTSFAEPDSATIATVLRALDGRVQVMATLAHSDLTFLQAMGSAAEGFALEYQDGSLDRHYRGRTPTLALAAATDIFQKYARGDASWRESLEWEHVPFVRPKIPWHSTWVGLILLLALVIVLFWFWRGPWG